jgi:phosphoribosyl-AMP cyclohydrolase
VRKAKLTVKPDFSKGGGLLPAIVQDAVSGRVLMLAYMNELAWDETVKSGKAHYWSRSRKQLWLKGEQSGHVQMVREIFLDCDLDTILLKVEQLGGAACHTGYASCFYRRYQDGSLEILENPIFDPKEVYKA